MSVLWPLLLLVSFVTAPYGAWPFDLVLLLPAIVQVVLKPSGDPVILPRSGVLACLAAINLACLAMNLAQVGSFWFLWVAPAVLLVYALAYRSKDEATPAMTPVFESAAT